jgi:hypothetical protein
VAGLAGLLALAAHAQLVPPDPDWKEAEAPPPPALRTEGLIALDVRGSSLRWGIDPASISVARDGVVRYVVVGLGDGGAVNGFYEGLRCSTGEVKVYARHAREGGWVRSTRLEWTALQAPAARHSLAIARGGACAGQAPNDSASQIARDLAASPNWRFRNEAR